MQFANKDVESIFFAALGDFDVTCEGCDKRFPVDQAKGYAHTMCGECLILMREGRLTFGDTDYTMHYCMGADNTCPMVMANTKYRTVDGVTTQYFTRMEYCPDHRV